MGIIDDYSKMYQYNISRFRKEQAKVQKEDEKSSTNQTKAVVSELKKQPESKPPKKKDTQKKPKESKGPIIGGIKLF
jgi:hypothetical protein